MKIKSLLIGSAALMTASTGAYAADAVVFAEPEPVEYVRICDVYGAGFFYIPGTETCLKIGGLVRIQTNFAGGFTGYNVLSRADTTFDARTETEWGTLRSFATLRLNHQWSATRTIIGATPTSVTYRGGYGVDVDLPAAYIEVIGASGTFRVGKDDSPYARFLGADGVAQFNSIFMTGYANNSGSAAEISYTFRGGNGFSGIIALVDNQTNISWGTNVEGGIQVQQGWGRAGVMIGYDGFTSTWGAKGVLAVTSGIFSGSLQAFYTSGPGSYQVSAAHNRWSVLGTVGVQANPKVGFNLGVQWYDSPATGGAWAFAGNVAWTPVQNLLIRPEITYATAGGASTWAGSIRFQRSF